MNAWLMGWWLLAEAAEGGEEGARGGLTTMLPAIILITVLYFYLFLRPQRQREQALRSKLENLKKNDRVVTIGGIYGTVTDVQREADKVTLKIDEATGAKLRVTVGAIARIITEDDAEGDKTPKS